MKFTLLIIFKCTVQYCWLHAHCKTADLQNVFTLHDKLCTHWKGTPRCPLPPAPGNHSQHHFSWMIDQTHCYAVLAAEPTFSMVQLLVSLMQWEESGFFKGTVYGHNTLKCNHVHFSASLHIKTCCESPSWMPTETGRYLMFSFFWAGNFFFPSPSCRAGQNGFNIGSWMSISTNFLIWKTTVNIKVGDIPYTDK